MKNLLKNCYFDGMTLAQAIEFASRVYQEVPTDRQIANVRKSIKESTGIDWK